MASADRSRWLTRWCGSTICLADLEAGLAPQVWAEAARSPVGQTVIACREHKTGHEIDVLALARGTRPRTLHAPIAFIGEAKHRDRRPGPAELCRLRHLSDLLTEAGHDASDAALGLFSAKGFTEELQAEAARSGGKILLASLEFDRHRSGGLEEVYAQHGIATDSIDAAEPGTER